jgi:SAM-dependent methyltransferase
MLISRTDNLARYQRIAPFYDLLDLPFERVDALPDAAVESFAGVGNSFSLGQLPLGAHVVDVGSGGGFDCFIAAGQIGTEGRVIGVDMTDEMLEKARATAASMGLSNVEFRKGIIEDMPVAAGWADVVISNGVINLCIDNRPCSVKSCGCCALAVGSSSPTSRTANPFPKRRSATLTSGLPELPEACRTQAGRRCWKRSGLWKSRGNSASRCAN